MRELEHLEEVGLHVPMVHVLCNVCGMSATMVVTDTGQLAWADHMATHDDALAFTEWTWMVTKLFP